MGVRDSAREAKEIGGDSGHESENRFGDHPPGAFSWGGAGPIGPGGSKWGSKFWQVPSSVNTYVPIHPEETLVSDRILNMGAGHR